MGVWLCDLDDVKRAIDVRLTARMDAQIARAIDAASDGIPELLHRDFAPVTAVREFDWPNFSYARPWRLWLDRNEMISVSSVVSGGVTLDPGTYFLRRSDDLDEPPYDQLQIDLAGPGSFNAGSSYQRSLAIGGLYAGCRNDEMLVGALTGPMGTTGSAGITMSPTVGVGAVLRIGTERMVVTAKTMVDSGQNLAGPGLAASSSDVPVPVTDGTAYEVDEVVLLGAERMLVVDIAGNNLIVTRGYDGTVLAPHLTGVDIYASAGFSVDRHQLGTTATTHTAADPIYRWKPPGLIRSLSIAESIVTLQQELAAYGRTVGSGDNAREASGAGLEDLRTRALNTFGRQARVGAI